MHFFFFFVVCFVFRGRRCSAVFLFVSLVQTVVLRSLQCIDNSWVPTRCVFGCVNRDFWFDINGKHTYISSFSTSAQVNMHSPSTGPFFCKHPASDMKWRMKWGLVGVVKPQSCGSWVGVIMTEGSERIKMSFYKDVAAKQKELCGHTS